MTPTMGMLRTLRWLHRWGVADDRSLDLWRCERRGLVARGRLTEAGLALVAVYEGRC